MLDLARGLYIYTNGVGAVNSLWFDGEVIEIDIDDFLLHQFIIVCGARAVGKSLLASNLSKYIRVLEVQDLKRVYNSIKNHINCVKIIELKEVYNGQTN